MYFQRLLRLLGVICCQDLPKIFPRYYSFMEFRLCEYEDWRLLLCSAVWDGVSSSVYTATQPRRLPSFDNETLANHTLLKTSSI